MRLVNIASPIDDFVFMFLVGEEKHIVVTT